VAFGETIFTEAFDLVKASFGEVILVAVLAHACHETLAEEVDGAGFFEGGECAAQTIRLGGVKARADDGDLHGLLLEKGHAEGFAQDFAERI